MVNYSRNTLDATFGALAHPTRRAILKHLARHDSSVKELARPLRVSLPAISKHLIVLEKSGLIVSEKRGRVRRCHLYATPLANAAEWINFYRQFWTKRLDGLDIYLQSSRGKK